MRVPLLAAFDKVEHCFDIVAVFGNNVERSFVLSTKWKQIQHVEFVLTLSKGRNLTTNLFDIVVVLATKSNVASTLLLVWKMFKTCCFELLSPGGINRTRCVIRLTLSSRSVSSYCPDRFF